MFRVLAFLITCFFGLLPFLQLAGVVLVPVAYFLGDPLMLLFAIGLIIGITSVRLIIRQRTIVQRLTTIVRLIDILGQAYLENNQPEDPVDALLNKIFGDGPIGEDLENKDKVQPDCQDNKTRTVS